MGKVRQKTGFDIIGLELEIHLRDGNNYKRINFNFVISSCVCNKEELNWSSFTRFLCKAEWYF
ncbi:hypothetical protein NC652_000754 [Populus alba x Populus x berolinensis]|nr:hypothetical protein NC652_000754 [Populus alba x Populus x berolinensis]